jgi:hypothetical protein
VRLTVVSFKNVRSRVAAVEKAIGRRDILEFGNASSGANTYAELENRVVRKVS